MRKHLKESPAATSIHSTATPDAALERLDQLGIAPTDDEKRFGRFPDVERRYSIRRSKCYELLNSGAIKSAVIKRKGARCGIRLIDMQSVENFLRSNTH